MATFGDLVTDLRTRKLNESSTAYFSDSTDLIPMLAQAERAVAAAFGFPRAVATGTVSTSFITPPTNTQAVLSLSVGILRLRKVERNFLDLYNYTAYPRFYFYDPAVGGNILIAPTPASPAPYALHYVLTFPESRASGDTVWNGLFPMYHEVVSMLATARAYEKGAASYETAAYWLQKAALMLRDMAGHLAQHGYYASPTALAQLTGGEQK